MYNKMKIAQLIILKKATEYNQEFTKKLIKNEKPACRKEPAQAVVFSMGFWCTDSLMKCWLSSLERKTLEPSVSLLMSAIS